MDLLNLYIIGTVITFVFLFPNPEERKSGRPGKTLATAFWAPFFWPITFIAKLILMVLDLVLTFWAPSAKTIETKPNCLNCGSIMTEKDDYCPKCHSPNPE